MRHDPAPRFQATLVKCPTCGHGEHRVIRTDEREAVVRRTRECAQCLKRWATVEAPEAVYAVARDVRDKVRAVLGALEIE